MFNRNAFFHEGDASVYLGFRMGLLYSWLAQERDKRSCAYYFSD
jgi:hypothetical protein